MAVSSAVSGTAEQTGDSSVRIRDEEPPGSFSETRVGDGDGIGLGSLLTRPGNLRPDSLSILINTNNLNLNFEFWMK